ncbi:hypothetical protein [Streptomyces kronopolitis]|uniref:hypothetical protein n=1 Tax=Streptomyces kronopolitis TaxID=1612435 RepID=UPI00341DD4C5
MDADRSAFLSVDQPHLHEPSAHDPGHLAAIAAELNRRPRKTLGWEIPAERLNNLLAA